MFRNITITVQNFGPIKKKTILTLNRFMLFSGTSGLGKSYLAMLVHYVYRIMCGDELHNFFKSQNIEISDGENTNTKEHIVYTLSSKELVEWINQQALTFMRDMLSNPKFNADISITFPHLPETIEFFYQRNTIEFEGDDRAADLTTLRIADSKLYLPPSPDNGLRPIYLSFTLRKYLRSIYKLNLQVPFFMPPSRGSLVAVPEDLIFRLRGSMGMYTYFLNDLSLLKSLSPVANVSTIAETAKTTLQEEVLHGDIAVQDNDMIYHVNNDDIPITAAASSIKELTPFALMIQKNLLRGYTILFEEPESHLHPELQIKVADLLSSSLNEGAHLQITTHSDFFLRHINDLINLFVLKRKNQNEEEYFEFCKSNHFDPNLAINPEWVNAYYFRETEEGVEVIQQDVSEGIPFDTFERVVDEQLSASSKLYDALECN